MKKIIIGQLMMWSNLIGVITGYVLFDMTGINSTYLVHLVGFLGVVGSCFNLFFAIALQFRGYKDGNIINFEI